MPVQPSFTGKTAMVARRGENFPLCVGVIAGSQDFLQARGAEDAA